MALIKQARAEHHGDDQRQLHHARGQHRYGSAGQRPGRVHFIKWSPGMSAIQVLCRFKVRDSPGPSKGFAVAVHLCCMLRTRQALPISRAGA